MAVAKVLLLVLMWFLLDFWKLYQNLTVIFLDSRLSWIGNEGLFLQENIYMGLGELIDPN